MSETPLQLWAYRARAARTAWLESFGVPISSEFVFFAETIGTLIELAEEDEQGKLLAAADALVEKDSHEHRCAFRGCTCGSIEKYKAARTEYLRLRRSS